jgi:hypothetical protein
MAGMRSEVEQHRDELIAAARRHRARNVRLFGSVATGRDRTGSDVNFSGSPGMSVGEIMLRAPMAAGGRWVRRRA